MFKNPSYSGITPEFWNSLDAICSVEEYVNWGVPNCGKGQPMQTMWTGHGAAPARFRNVQVGIATPDDVKSDDATSDDEKPHAKCDSEGGAK
jgi:TldD protein